MWYKNKKIFLCLNYLLIFLFWKRKQKTKRKKEKKEGILSAHYQYSKENDEGHCLVSEKG